MDPDTTDHSKESFNRVIDKSINELFDDSEIKNATTNEYHNQTIDNEEQSLKKLIFEMLDKELIYAPLEEYYNKLLMDSNDTANKKAIVNIEKILNIYKNPKYEEHRDEIFNLLYEINMQHLF